MSDSDDGFEIDLGEPKPAPVIKTPTPAPAPVVHPKQTPTAKKQEVTKPIEKPKEVVKHIEPKKEESKDEYDDFEIIQNDFTPPSSQNVKQPLKEEAKHVAESVKAEISVPQQVEYMLPIPPQEQQNAYFFMNQVSLILNDNGTITPLTNESQIYDKSAIWALYGPESKGYNFLITGGMYAEKEDVEEDKYAEKEEIYHYHYGTSRTFTVRLMPKGTLQLKRYTNMLKLRYMHWVVNWWNGYNNRIFVIGGQSKSDVLNSTEYYDFNTNKWIAKANMNSPRSVFSVVNINEYIYAFGGFKDYQYFSEPSLERYSILDNSWESIDLAELQLSSKWGSTIWRTYDNQLLILGGYATINSDDPSQQIGYQSLHRVNTEDWSIEVLNSEGFWMPMSKFITTNGVIFKSIGSLSGFNILEYNIAENQWFGSNSAWGFQNMMNDTKHGGQKIINSIIYSSALTHNFF